MRLSYNGASSAANVSTSAFGPSGVMFTYLPDPVVYDMIPDIGSVRGGTRVRLVGDNFVASTTAACRFGTSVVRLVWVDGSTALCVTPASSSGTARVEVSMNGVDFFATGFAFRFVAPPHVAFISPVAGPAVAAGTDVSVYGFGFYNTSMLTCRFADVVVPATFISSTRVSCAAPPILEGLRYQNMITHVTRDAHPIHGSRRLFPTAHTYPYVYSRLVAVDLSNNAQEFTDSGVRYLVQGDARVTDVFPRQVRSDARAPLFVLGAGFINTTSLRCRVGTAFVPASYVTSEFVICYAPQRMRTPPAGGTYFHGSLYNASGMDVGDAARVQDDAVGRVYVEVSNNGVDFTVDKKTVEYTGPCAQGRYCPGFESTADFECPRGAYCPGVGNRNFTMCPPGTYQPLTAQATCFRCPVGFICPQYGMYVPRVCPAGYVCAVTGSVAAEQPCPAGHWCLEGTATTATTCGNPLAPSATPFMTEGHAEMTGTLRLSRQAARREVVLGARNAGCWDNSTSDLGLQTSRYPARFWAEAHLLPLSPNSNFEPMRGRTCLDDACLRLSDAEALPVTDPFFG
ncbi:hypothetical protein EON62_03345, partial [archaeon]